MRRELLNRWWAVVLLMYLASAAGAAEQIVYVDAAATGDQDGTSWTDAYLRLQDAFTEVAETSDPVEIRVAQGTYRASDGGAWSGRTISTFELRNHLILAGGYAGVVGSDPDARDVERYRTVLTGVIAASDTPDGTGDPPERNCRVILTGREIDETAVLDGLTITRASNYGMDLNLASPSLNRCRFVDNGFAGIDAWDCNSVLVDCTFERNGSGTISKGGIDSVRGHLTLTDCAFIENDGGGIDNSGTLDLLRCSFVSNTAFNATAIDHSGDLTARQCVFTGNQSQTDGAVECNGTATLTDCTFTGNSSNTIGAIQVWGTLNLVDCEFTGNSGGSGPGAVMILGDMLNARGCLFAGNSCLHGPGAILNHSAAILRLSNCTFTGNRGRPNAVEHPPIPGAIAEMTQCIVWDGPDPFTAYPAFPPEIAVTRSNVQGGYAGEGNIDVDPLFVDPGYWDTNDTPADANDDVWIAGDYHLKSQAGQWDEETEDWVFDEVTSPCIDAGDPNVPLGAEPFPNGGFVNLGGYGATVEASRSYFGTPVCENQLAGDINGDCKVDDLDMDILMSHWLMEAVEVDNVPPTITLISPAEGDEFTSGMPMVLRAETSDPDGRVIRVSYHLTSRSESGTSATGATATDPTDDWMVSWDGWSRVTIAPDRTYTIQAEAMDDQGATTLTPEVEIKLGP
jgi:parallel beta helix pectate lyase-like protein/Big-like domain-containing protein/disaggregatase-related protein